MQALKCWSLLSKTFPLLHIYPTPTFQCKQFEKSNEVTATGWLYGPDSNSNNRIVLNNNFYNYTDLTTILTM